MQPRGSSLGCGRMPSGSSLAARSASASCGQVVDHGVQHQVPAGQRTVGVGVGVQRAGRLHQAGQQRGLLPVQFRGVDAEVGLRGVLHAERVVAERHQVQVAGEDLRLGERLVQRQRHPDLAQLARRCGLDGGALLGVGLRDHQQLVVLHVLLLDGRAAAGVEVAGHVAGQARQRALPVHAVVLGKPLVLDRDDRQLHRVGDLVAGHLEPALRVQPRDDVALGVDHRRHRGTSPSTSWAEPLATTSEARFDSSPNPPTTGNISAAATTLANRQHHASLMTVTVVGGRVGGCSGMRTE